MNVNQYLTAIEIVNKKINTTFFLPPIQRGFVWPIEKIESLFDSLYHDYPVGIPIIWKINKWERKTCPLFYFYEEAEGNEDHLEEAKKTERGKRYFVVLDGQQRLTALFLGIKGYFKVKRKGKGLKNIEDNFEKQYLCFNLAGDEKIKKGEDEESKVPLFKFKTEEECLCWTKNNFWIPLYEFCENIKDSKDISSYVKQQKKRIPKNLIASSEKIDFTQKFHFLYAALYKTIIHYFEVELDGLKEDVSEIFARVNTKGTPLTKADLLFSRIVAEWPEGKDFFNDLTKLLKKNLALTKAQDFVMRSTLYINDYPVQYDLDAFNTSRIKNIKKDENTIRLKNAISCLMNEKIRYAYTQGISENALLPILYLIAKRQDANKKISSSEWKQIKKYYIISQALGLFSGSSDTTLAQMRKVVKACVDGKRDFSIEYLKQQKTSDEIKKFFKSASNELSDFLQRPIYRNRGLAHLMLSVITKDVNGDTVSNGQLDHIHPESTIKKDEWKDLKDSLDNLELLSDSYNQSKNAKPLDEFLNNVEYFPNTKVGRTERKEFIKENFIPTNEELWKLKNFDKFCKERQKLLMKKLKPWFE